MAVSGQIYTPAALPPGKEFAVTFEWKAGRNPALASSLWRRQNPLTAAGIRTTFPLLSVPQPSQYTKLGYLCSF